MLNRVADSVLPSGLEGKDRFAARWGLAYLVLLVLSSTVLLRTLSESGNIETWRRIIAWLSLGTVAFFIVAANRYLQQDATDESQRRHLRVIRQQLVNVSPRRLTIHESESLRSYRYEVHKLLKGRETGQTTVRESLAEFWEAWRDQTRVVPGLALKLAYEAALLLIFGAVVVLPVSWWSGSDPSGFATPPIAGWVMAILGAFPASELLFTLGLAAVMTVGQVLFEHWFVLSMILFLGAALIAWLDRETAEDLDVTLYPNRRLAIGSVISFVVLVFLAGSVPAAVLGTLFGAVGLGFVADLVGLLAVAYLVVVVGRDAVADLRARLVMRQQWPDENTELVAAYLVVRKVWALIGVACLPLLVAYIALAFGTGSFFAVALELATAPWHIRLPALAAVIAAALLIRSNYPDLTNEFAEALRRATSSSVVRGFIFARGIPLLAVVVGFGVAWPMFGFKVALAVGLLVGAIARIATLVWQVAAYRFVDFADRESGSSEVVVEAFELEDADGEAIYVARVDGHELAHRERDVLVDIVLEVAEQRLEERETPATFAHYYFEEVTEHGRVDIDFVADEYQGDIKTRVVASLRENGGELEVESLDEQMTEKYAESAYRRALSWLRKHGDVDVRRGKYVLH